MIRVSAFRWVPPFARGLVRDLRVRWALEEAGLPYAFESGAIVLHVAERSEALMPSDPKRRARVTTWMFAALNTMEPRIQNLAEVDLFHAEEAWAKLRRPAAVEAANARLASLAGWLGGRHGRPRRAPGRPVISMSGCGQRRRTTDVRCRSDRRDGAPVDDILASGDRRCPIRGEEGDQLGDLCRPARTAKRDTAE
jgi:hypothetical protein